MLRPYLKKAPAGAASRADAVSLLCVLAEASAAGVDKAKAACTADKVWALTLKAKDSFLWQDSSAATEREAAALLRLLASLLLALPTQLALCGDGGGHALKALLTLAASPHAFPRTGALALLAPVARLALGVAPPDAAAGGAASAGVSVEKLSP